MRLAKLVSVLAAGLLLAGTALAQQRPGGLGGGGFGGGFGGFGGGLAGMIGQSKQLQDELKMDKDQVDKLTEALAKVREDLRDETAKLRDRNTSEETRTEITKKVREANDKAVAAVLQPEQLKRLHQIENQRSGVGMFAKEDVKKALKLSDEQNEKIKDINEDLQKDLRELSGGGRGGRGQGGRGGFDPEAQQKRQAVQKEAMDNVVKVLNDEQKATLKDLTGAPFELRFEGFGAGGAGGFGGGFGGPPQAGQVLSTFTQERLKLTDDQKKQLEELQKDVDGKLEKILTEDQNKQLKEMRDGGGRGTGGRGRGRRGTGNPPQ
jgi:hypothetical protein